MSSEHNRMKHVEKCSCCVDDDGQGKMTQSKNEEDRHEKVEHEKVGHERLEHKKQQCEK